MGLLFRKVAYTRYDVTWFLEQMDFMTLEASFWPLTYKENEEKKERKEE
jgi:hypothetical protein